jgi:hypothetical protein
MITISITSVTRNTKTHNGIEEPNSSIKPPIT